MKSLISVTLLLVATHLYAADPPPPMPHAPNPPTPNCQCGCTETGSCTCKDCDHPALVKPKKKVGGDPNVSPSPTPEPTPTPTPAPNSVTAPPVAALSAPSTAAVGAPLLLDPTGTSADSFELFTVSGPTRPKVLLMKDESGAVVYGLVVLSSPGTYRFGEVAWGPATTNGAKPAHSFAFTDVVVGNPTPTPSPNPSPNPNPTPSALGAAFQSAYAKDTDSSKSLYLSYLKTVYSDPNVVPTPGNYGQLFNSLSAAIHKSGVGLPNGAMPNLSAAIGAELKSAFGVDPTATYDAARVSAELSRVASALGEVK